MKKTLIVSGSLFFLLLTTYIYFYSREYNIYEVNADNYTELEKITDVDYFKAYANVISPYYGFGNLRMIQPGIRERITERSDYYAQFDYSGGNETFEGYGANLVDCTRLSVQMENGIITKILQLDSKSCSNDVLRERVDFLKDKGFILSESQYVNGHQPILIKELNNDYFHIVRFHYNTYEEKVTAIEFSLYSKAKYPSLRFI